MNAGRRTGAEPYSCLVRMILRAKRGREMKNRERKIYNRNTQAKQQNKWANKILRIVIAKSTSWLCWSRQRLILLRPNSIFVLSFGRCVFQFVSNFFPCRCFIFSGLYSVFIFVLFCISFPLPLCRVQMSFLLTTMLSIFIASVAAACLTKSNQSLIYIFLDVHILKRKNDEEKWSACNFFLCSYFFLGSVPSETLPHENESSAYWNGLCDWRY